MQGAEGFALEPDAFRRAGQVERGVHPAGLDACEPRPLEDRLEDPQAHQAGAEDCHCCAVVALWAAASKPAASSRGAMVAPPALYVGG